METKEVHTGKKNGIKEKVVKAQALTTCKDDFIPFDDDWFAQVYMNFFQDFYQNNFTHYWLSGGRGSGKSSFAALCLVLSIMRNSGNGEITNGIVLRKIGNRLKESVFEQILWAIDKLEASMYWEAKRSVPELIYTPTNAKISFYGAADAKRLKSVKASSGRFSFVWFEEADEFGGMQEIRTILQSVIRGEGNFSVFYTFNPPRMSRHWINDERFRDRKNRLLFHTTYLDIPPEWLGQAFIEEAEQLKESKPLNYKHEYLGETGVSGAEVFQNVVLKELDKEEIEGLFLILRGMDFGFAVDPFAYIVLSYDKKRKKIHLFYEIYEIRLSNSRAASIIRLENTSNGYVFADSAEPKSIAELRELGINVVPAKKGPDSIYYGIKFLQDLNEIVIDPIRCPNAAREFLSLSYESDGNGGFLNRYRGDDHIIDATRYALEQDMRQNARIREKKGVYGNL